MDPGEEPPEASRTAHSASSLQLSLPVPLLGMESTTRMRDRMSRTMRAVNFVVDNQTYNTCGQEDHDPSEGLSEFFTSPLFEVTFAWQPTTNCLWARCCRVRACKVQSKACLQGEDPRGRALQALDTFNGRTGSSTRSRLPMISTMLPPFDRDAALRHSVSLRPLPAASEGAEVLSPSDGIASSLSSPVR